MKSWLAGKQNLSLQKLTIFIVLFGIVFGGCGTVDLKVRKNLDHPNIHPNTVAILPFTLAGPTPEGVPIHRLFRECFFNYFSYLGYVDIPLETIDHKLGADGMKKYKEVLGYSPEKLRDILAVDAVIKGQVLETNNFTGGIHAETSIKAKIEMIDLRTGETLWETEHKERIYSGILSPNFVEIIQDQMDNAKVQHCLLYTSPSPRDATLSRMPSSA